MPHGKSPVNCKGYRTKYERRICYANAAATYPTELGETLGKVAEEAKAWASAMPQGASDLRNALNAIGKRLEKVSEKLKTLGSVGEGLTTIVDMYRAWDALTPDTIRTDPGKAAYNFGRLFRGVGKLGSHLPGQWGEAAKFVGKFADFFVQMQDMLDLESVNTTYGNGLREALRVDQSCWTNPPKGTMPTAELCDSL